MKEGIVYMKYRRHRIKKNKLNKIKDVIFYIFIIVSLSFSVLFAMSNDKNKSIFGYRYYSILSNSMEPSYKKGDMVFVKLIPYDKVKIGDAVSFVINTRSNTTVTHRVVDILPNGCADGTTGFVTKGDNNKEKDPFLVSEKNIIGVVIGSIPLIGEYVQKLKENIFAVVCMSISFILFSHTFKWYLSSSKTGTERVRRRKRAIN